MGRQDAESETLIPTRGADFDVADYMIPVKAYDTRNGMAPHGNMNGDEISPTLRAKEHEPPMIGPVIAFPARMSGTQFASTENVSSSIGAINPTAIATAWAVRRLTPTECERLQGFPDGYTDVPPRNKNHTPDGPRYKQLGNSMAVNCMRWLGTRIQMIEFNQAKQEALS